MGTPQWAALVLLAAFLLQCLWFAAHLPLTAGEGNVIESGLVELEHLSTTASSLRSPLVPLIAGVAARLSGGEKNFAHISDYRLPIRLPFILFGALLGASLWYVARRLYGNLGGYVALSFYCFSPTVIGASGEIGAQVLGAWGAFGLIFTAIAVSHTLYAPREVVLWNWRRILLLGLSIAICVGAQFSFWLLLIPALAFMLWVGHVRPAAAMAIFFAACAVAVVLLFATYAFRPAVFVEALRHAYWLEISHSEFSLSGISLLLRTFFLQNGIGLLLLLAVALVTFAVWKRARFFGTAAPLITGVLLVLCALRMHYSGFAFLFLALPFLILFMAGVSADLLESRYAVFANAIIVGVLVANAIMDVYGLMHLTMRSR